MFLVVNRCSMHVLHSERHIEPAIDARRVIAQAIVEQYFGQKVQAKSACVYAAQATRLIRVAVRTSGWCWGWPGM